MPTAFLPDRAVLSVAGPDARSFLQALVTCDVEALQDSQAAFGALLTPQGKILFDFFVVCAESETFLLDTSADTAAALAKRLSLYKLRAKIVVETTAKQVLVAWGGGGIPDGIVYGDPRVPQLGQRVILDVVDDPGDAAAYDAHRIALGIPKGGSDFAWGDTFPHEANMDWLGGISLTKGCYVGQEVVSRMHHRGTARRRILRATFEGDPPPAGSEIRAGDIPLGTFGSGVSGRGLAGVRIDRLAEATSAGKLVTATDRPITIAVPE